VVPLTASEWREESASGASIAEIEAVYRASFARFLAVAAMICRDADVGGEVVQEAFAQAIRSRRSFRRDAPLEAWIWRITVNAAQRTGRAHRPIPLSDLRDDASVGPPDDSSDALRALLAELPERQRTVVFLRFCADLDYRAIARVLDMRVGTVGATINAALSTLRRRMTTSEVGSDV
jgi:RNA polymerase sigma factor (sigma-70 family)